MLSFRRPNAYNDSKRRDDGAAFPVSTMSAGRNVDETSSRRRQKAIMRQAPPCARPAGMPPLHATGRTAKTFVSTAI
jgi:hypothetical protein